MGEVEGWEGGGGGEESYNLHKNIYEREGVGAGLIQFICIQYLWQETVEVNKSYILSTQKKYLQEGGEEGGEGGRGQEGGCGGVRGQTAPHLLVIAAHADSAGARLGRPDLRFGLRWWHAFPSHEGGVHVGLRGLPRNLSWLQQSPAFIAIAWVGCNRHRHLSLYSK